MTKEEAKSIIGAGYYYNDKGDEDFAKILSTYADGKEIDKDIHYEDVLKSIALDTIDTDTLIEKYNDRNDDYYYVEQCSHIFNMDLNEVTEYLDDRGIDKDVLLEAFFYGYILPREDNYIMMKDDFTRFQSIKYKELKEELKDVFEFEDSAELLEDAFDFPTTDPDFEEKVVAKANEITNTKKLELNKQWEPKKETKEQDKEINR